MATSEMDSLTRRTALAMLAGTLGVNAGCQGRLDVERSSAPSSGRWTSSVTSDEDLARAVQLVRERGLFAAPPPSPPPSTGIAPAPERREDPVRLAGLAGPPWSAVLVSLAAARPVRVQRGDTAFGLRVLQVWPDSVRARTATGQVLVLSLTPAAP
jgi:hypothetical protein